MAKGITLLLAEEIKPWLSPYEAMLLVVEADLEFAANGNPPAWFPVLGNEPHCFESIVAYNSAKRLLRGWLASGDVRCVCVEDEHIRAVTAEEWDYGYCIDFDKNVLFDPDDALPVLRGIKVDVKATLTKLKDRDQLVLDLGPPLRPGPKPDQSLRVRTAMLTDVQNGFNLKEAKEEALAARYGASRYTCHKCRNEILSELGG